MRLTGNGQAGPSSFKKLDAERAIRSAREAGLEPAMTEIERKDGTTFLVYGDKTTAQATQSAAGGKK
jgi:hypothetical protein